MHYARSERIFRMHKYMHMYTEMQRAVRLKECHYSRMPLITLHLVFRQIALFHVCIIKFTVPVYDFASALIVREI